MFNQFARHEQAFVDWRRDGYPGVKAETYQYIDFLSAPDNDQAPREGTLWPHQWQAFLRVVYSHEILGKTEIGAKGLLLNVVTGGGKTVAIAALIAWLRVDTTATPDRADGQNPDSDIAAFVEGAEQWDLRRRVRIGIEAQEQVGDDIEM